MSNTIHIDIGAICNNISTIQKIGKKIIFVAKGNVYGFGYGLIPHIDTYIDKYAVGSISEAHKVTQYTKKKILILSPVMPQDVVEDDRFIYSVASTQQINAYSRSSLRSLNLAIKVNTGLNRYGMAISELGAVFSLAQKNGYTIADVYTHLASSTSQDNFQDVFWQYEHFHNALDEAARFIDPKSIDTHFTDTATLLRVEISQPVTSVRTGMSILGLDPIPDIDDKRFPLSFPYRLESAILDKHRICAGDYYGYEKKARQQMFTCTIGIGYCDGIRKSWIGHDIIHGAFGKMELLDVSMNNSIFEVPKKAYDSIRLLDTSVTIVSSQKELTRLAKLSNTSIEDVLYGFVSTNNAIHYS